VRQDFNSRAAIESGTDAEKEISHATFVSEAWKLFLKPIESGKISSHDDEEIDDGKIFQSTHTGSQSTHTGSQSTHTGNQSTHTGSQSTHTGNQSTHTGSQSTHTGSQSTHTGSQSINEAQNKILQLPFPPACPFDKDSTLEEVYNVMKGYSPYLITEWVIGMDPKIKSAVTTKLNSYRQGVKTKFQVSSITKSDEVSKAVSWELIDLDLPKLSKWTKECFDSTVISKARCAFLRVCWEDLNGETPKTDMTRFNQYML